MLKEPCPYHKGGANHKLEDCHMLNKYFDSLGLKKDDERKDEGDDKGGSKDNEGFPAVHDCYMIYGGTTTQLTSRQCKRERREVFASRMAVPQYSAGRAPPSSLTTTTTDAARCPDLHDVGRTPITSRRTAG
jgi:hypothetical protein